MTIRTELEAPLRVYAQANNIPVAWEGEPFTKPNGKYLRIFFLDKTIFNPTIDFESKRTVGAVQIDVCAPVGTSNKVMEDFAEAIAALYPSANKQAFATVSIEQHPQIGRIMLDANFRIIPVTIRYRQEANS